MLAYKSLSVKRKIFCFLRSLDKFQQLLHEIQQNEKITLHLLLTFIVDLDESNKSSEYRTMSNK